jgi:hypothetical protein
MRLFENRLLKTVFGTNMEEAIGPLKNLHN